MSLVYSPANAPFQQVRLPIWGKSPWGLDTATIQWAGPAPKLDEFLGSLIQGVPLFPGSGSPGGAPDGPIYGGRSRSSSSGFVSSPSSVSPAMYLSTWTTDPDPAFPRVDLNYIGTLNGALPDPLISDDLGTGAATQTIGDDGPPETQRNGSISFYSPQRTYRYIMDSRPTGPRFSDCVGGPVSNPSIRSFTITDGNGRRRSSGISFTAGAELFGFVVDPVPGTPFFECTETWSGVFV